MAAPALTSAVPSPALRGRTVVIVNPAGRNGANARAWRRLEARVVERLGGAGSVTVELTNAPGSAEALSRAAVRGGAARVVAVGGDGTVSEVLNGFFEGDRCLAGAGSGCTLGVLPMGSGSDLRRTLAWPTKPDAALERLCCGSPKPLDVVRARVGDGRGGQRTKYYGNVASAGVSGAIVQSSQRYKSLGGRAAYALGTIEAFVRRLYRNSDVELRVDEGEWFGVDAATLVAAGNGRFFGGGMRIAPGADPHDGLLDVTVLNGFGPFGLAVHGPSLYTGAFTRLSRCRQVRARRLDVRLRHPVPGAAEVFPVEADGEAVGVLPLTLSVVPGAIDVIV